MRFICSKLEQLRAGKIDRLLIAAPPGHGKSWLGSHHFPGWILGQDPTCNVIAVSHTDELAAGWGRKVRNLVMSAEHQRLFPTSIVSEDNRAGGRWGLTEGGEYFAVGVGGAVIGRRADWVVIDDPLRGAEDAESETVRKNMWLWFTSDLITRLRPNAKIILIATRWHLEDLTGRLLEESRSGRGDRWETVVLPAIANDRDPLNRAPGEALWPESYPVTALERIKSLESSRQWEALYQQNPVPESGGIIDRTWFKTWKQPAPPKLDFVLQSWDTALTAKDTSSYSACLTFGVFTDKETGVKNLILLSAWRGRLEWPELRRMVARMARDYLDQDLRNPITYSNEGKRPDRRPDTILIEAKASGHILILDLLRANITATPFNPDKFGDKIQRVRLATDIIENGRLWLPGQPPGFSTLRWWAEQFAHQCSLFPATETRDYVDCMTQAILRIKQSGWVPNTEDGPPLPEYAGEPDRPALY